MKKYTQYRHGYKVVKGRIAEVNLSCAGENNSREGKELYMKRLITITSALLVLLLIIPVGAAKDITKAYNWYCCHVNDGTQPVCDVEMQFIKDYNGYYIDHNNSDPIAEEKVIYLTFDAGYENGNVEKILNILREENVPGAFFVLENLIVKNPDLIQRMASEGHLVCNHTAKHHDMTKYHTSESFLEELHRLEAVCEETAGVKIAPYYRPPEGRFSEENLKFASEAGYKTIFWSFGYVDWDNERQMSPKDALEKILSGIHNGEVLLLHPTSATNADIMGDLIGELRNRGYRFGTLDELTTSKTKE